MKAPETIYLAVIENVAGTTYVPAIKSSDPTSIPYHWEKECVWKPTTAHHMTSCGRHAMVKQGNYCPYCGGTIRIEEDT